MSKFYVQKKREVYYGFYVEAESEIEAKQKAMYFRYNDKEISPRTFMTIDSEVVGVSICTGVTFDKVEEKDLHPYG